MIVHPFTVPRMSPAVCCVVTLVIWLVSVLVSLPLGVYQRVLARPARPLGTLPSHGHRLLVDAPDDNQRAADRTPALVPVDVAELLDDALMVTESAVAGRSGLESSGFVHPTGGKAFGVGANVNLAASIDYGDDDPPVIPLQMWNSEHVATACSEDWPQEDSRQLFTVSSFGKFRIRVIAVCS